MKLKDFDFRIWSNTGSEYLVTPDKTFHDYQCNKRKNMESKYETYYQDLELERYTGFKDENGDKIYEGDIVDTGDFRDVVKFEKSKGWILQETLDRLDDYQDWQLEVIGNIHEDKNPNEDSIEQSNTNRTKRMR